MGLYQRLTRIDLDLTVSSKIPVHQFAAAMGELERGQMTKAQIVSAFALTASEEAELDTLIPKIQPLPESYALGAITVLTNVGTAYDTIAPAKGLGFVAVDIRNITQVILRIRYNKVGSGTLSWQLWNETDAQEIGVFNDSGAAGDNKQNDITVSPGSPLTGGVKLLRVRVKSTVAADDPVYYGSTLLVRRTAALTSEHLHHLLMIAEQQIPPLDSIAAVKSRLGV